MACNGESLMRSLRETLAKSDISAVAIAVLLLWSIESALQSLWGPLYQTASLLFTAIAILDIPYPLWNDTPSVLFTSAWYLSYALISFSAAWFLARWVYGVGPVSSLKKCRGRLAQSNHA
jgi:hypothetical protein